MKNEKIYISKELFNILLSNCFNAPDLKHIFCLTVEYLYNLYLNNQTEIKKKQFLLWIEDQFKKHKYKYGEIRRYFIFNKLKSLGILKPKGWKIDDWIYQIEF